MVTGNTKLGGRFTRSVPRPYCPYSTAGAAESWPLMESSRLRTICVSSRVMMLMAELLRVMGTPMDKTRFISVPPEGGASSEGVLSRWRNR